MSTQATPGDSGGNGSGADKHKKKHPPQRQPVDQGEHGGSGGGVPDEGGPRQDGVAHGTVGQIIQFLRGKGLSDPVIAGILGNMRVETGSTPFSTRAYNPGEGAIGLCQWEGGRRTALQQFAAARGMSETDLEAQLEYLWHELTTTESGVLNALRGVTSATEAANIWNRQFERSADYSNNRENYAASYLADGFHGISSQNLGSGGGDIPSSGGSGVSPLSANVERLSPASLGNDVGLSGALLKSVPELRSILQQAMSGNWTLDRFENAVVNSDWYKNHSSTARSILTEQISDPATYDQQIRQAEQAIQHIANQNGWDVTPDQLQNIARSALLSGNDTNTDWINQQLGRRQDYTGLKDVDKLQGNMATTADQLQQIAGDYGFHYQNPAVIAHQAKQILMGNQTVDTYTQQMRDWAKSAFPALAKMIDQGHTVAEAASPYVSTMSNLLEVDPATLGPTTGMIRRALQGTAGVGSKDGGAATLTPLWQFEQQVRNDPRWQYTQNARQDVAQTLMTLGQDWGFQ